MTDKDISVVLEERTVLGKGLRTLRNEGKVPAVIHDHGKDSMHVAGEYTTLVKAYADAGKHHPVHLTVGGKKHLAIIKDAHFEPSKHRLEHIVFQAIKQNEKVSAEIPVVLVGDDIPAEKKGLIILTQVSTITVDALPNDLPDQLTVDATKLENDSDNLTVADIVAPKGVTITAPAEQVIAIVEMPRDQIAEANASAESLAEDAGKPAQEVASEEPKTEE
jgi:large subunit ribosomal protein L25